MASQVVSSSVHLNSTQLSASVNESQSLDEIINDLSAINLDNSFEANKKAKVSKEDQLVAQFNQIALEDNEYAWFLTNTQKGGFKVISNGYGYNIDRPKLSDIRAGWSSTVLWKCESQACKGRAKTTQGIMMIIPMI